MWVALWHHLVLHSRPCMSINPSKMWLHLIFTVRIGVMGPKWIPWCRCPGSELLHIPGLCLPSLRLCVKSLKHARLFILWCFPHHIKATNKNCPPVYFCPKRPPRVPLTSVLTRKVDLGPVGDFSPDHRGWGSYSLTNSSLFQAHLTPAMSLSWKHIDPHGACSFNPVSEWAREDI